MVLFVYTSLLPWIIILFLVILTSSETPTATTKELRPEYIHPEGVEALDPYFRELLPKDQQETEEDEEEDYLPLPDNQEGTQGLPIFLMEPKNSYSVKNVPATLICSAANALQVFYKCNGERTDRSIQLDHVDPQNGVRIVESELNVTKEDLSRYYGDKFTCECFAWNSKGHIKSQDVIVELAYIKKQFTHSPQSTSVEVGRSVKFRCVSPPGVPPPTLKWMRNGVPLEAADEYLVLPNVGLRDIANYSCVSENIGGRRESDPAVLTVYANGGWSDWSPWMPCRCGAQSAGRRRSRICNNPSPANGGAPCRGLAVQRSDDCLQCQNGGVWSSWSTWSPCNEDCLRTRRRVCTGTCSGPGMQHAACVDGLCDNRAVDNKPAILLGVAFGVAILVTVTGVFIYYCKKKRSRPGYTMANSGEPKPDSRSKGEAPDLTRSCNDYWMTDNHYDMPHVRDSYSTPFARSNSRQQSNASNHYEMKPYSPSGDSGSSCYTYTRTMTSRSSDYSTSQLAELVPNSPTSSKVDVAVTLPNMAADSSYRDKICLTVLK